MINQELIIERTFDAPIEKVWQALTDINHLRQWYFNLREFRAEKGFEFSFDGGTEENTYHHLCQITELIPGKKIAYSWRYEGFEGYSEVSFELFQEGRQTRLQLIHTGLESFPQNNPDFARKNFEMGWTEIIGNSLRKFLEK